MLKKLLFFAFGLLLVHVSYSQVCNITSKANDLIPDRTCGPVGVVWEVIYRGVNPGADVVTVQVNWDNGTPVQNYAAMLTNAGLKEYTANITFSYPANGTSCVYQPTAYLRVGNTVCLGTAQQQNVKVWGRDNQNGGVVSLTPNIINVCVGNSTTLTFADATTLNCVPPAETDDPNNQTRNVMFRYGTNSADADFLTGVSVTGSRTGANSFGVQNFTTFPAVEPKVQQMTGPVTAASLITLTVNVPVTTAGQVGKEFDVIMYYWNVCNPWNGVHGAGANIVDAVTATATVRIVSEVTGDIVVRNTSDVETNTFCPSQGVRLREENIINPQNLANLRYLWEVYDGPTTASRRVFNFSFAAGNTNRDFTITVEAGTNVIDNGKFATTGQKLVRMKIRPTTTSSISGACESEYSELITITATPIAVIRTDGSTTVTDINSCEEDSDIGFAFTEASTGKNATTQSIWKISRTSAPAADVFASVSSTGAAVFNPAGLNAFDFKALAQVPGVYEVSLRTRDTNTGCETSDLVNVIVYDQPSANFTATDICQGNNSSFTDASSLGIIVNGDAISKWEWDFNWDGVNGNFTSDLTQTSSPGTFTRNLGSAGTYKVGLRVTTRTDRGECISTIFSRDVIVRPIPAPTFTSNFVNGTLCPGGQVIFTNTSAEGALAAAVKPITYELEIKQGANPASLVLFGGAAPTATLMRSFSNATAGNLVYTVRLKATGANGCPIFSPSQNITVNPGAPSNFNITDASGSTPYNSFDDNCSPLPLRFTPDAATLALNATSYTWTVRYGAIVEHTITSAANQFNYAFTNVSPSISSKTFTVELQPNKAGVCISSITKNVKVNPKPNSNFTISIVSEDCDEVTYRLDATQKGLVDYDWGFDPAPFSFISGGIAPDNNVIEVTYQRPSAAASSITPEFTLTTTNNLNCVSSETDNDAPLLVKRDDVVPVLLSAVSPVPIANPMDATQQLINSCAPSQIVTFNNNTIQASLPPATTYELFITKNGGTPFEAVAPKLTGDLTFKSGSFSYLFDEVGVYEVELRALLPSTCTPFSTPPVLVRVYPKPLADFTVNTSTNCGLVAVTLDDISSITNPGGSLPSSALGTRTWSIRDTTNNLLLAGSPFTTPNSTAFSNANTLLTNPNANDDAFIDYEITMSVVTDQGCISDNKVKTVRVYKQAEVGLSVLAPNPACETDYEFEFDIDPRNNPVGTEYSINFGDGGVATTFSASVANITHLYSNPLSFNNQYQYTAIITARTPDGCTATASTVVTLRPRLKANFVADKSQGCSPVTVNFSNVSLGANITPTWSYRKVGDAAFTPFTTANANSPQQIFTNATAAAIDYEVRLVIVNTATCTDDTIAATPIKVFPSFTTSSILNTNSSVCAGEADVIYNVTSPNAGSQYQWTVAPAAASTAGGFIVDGQLTDEIEVDFLSNAGSVNITVVETNANGCVGSPATKTITVNPLPTATVSGTTSICIGESRNLTFNLGGSTGPYDVVYNDGSGDSTLTNVINGKTVSVTPTATTSYTLVSVTDRITGCSNTNLGTSALITVKPLPTATLSGTNTICSGQSSNLVFNFGGTGPWSYSYTDGSSTFNATSNQSTAIVTKTNITATTTYTLTSVTDAVSCNKTITGQSVTVTVNPLPSATISSTQSSVCINSAPTLSIKFNSGTAPYTVKYRANGGAAISLFNVTPQDAVNNIYTFSPSSISASTTYTLAEVTDSNTPNCGTTNTALLTGSPTIAIDALPLGEISANAVFTPRTSSSTICSGGSQQIHFKLTGKTANPFFNVVYSDGTSNFMLNGIQSGHFVTINNITSNKTFSIVSIFDQSSGCQNNSVVSPALQVNVRALPTATIVGTTSICEGSSTNLVFTATGTSPFEVDYSDGTSTSTLMMASNSRTISVGPTSTKTYSILAVRDGVSSSLSCSNTSITSSAVVTIYPAFASDAIANTNSSACAGQNGVVYSIATPNASSTYQWSISPTAAGSIDNGQGTSSVTINFQNQANAVVLSVVETDMNGCQGSARTKNVTVNPLPTATISGTTSICFNSNANLSFTAGGGTGPYSVEYSDGTGVNKFVTVQPNVTAIVPKTNLTATTNYALVAVRDVTTTCSRPISGSALITVRPLPTIAISGNATICRGQTTNVTLNLGGNGPWEVKMRKGALDTTITNITTSTFQVPVKPNVTTVYRLLEVKDVNSCQRTGLTDLVTVNVNPLPAAVISGTQSICINSAPTLKVTFTSGTSPYSVTYSANGVNNTLFNVVPNGSGEFFFSPSSINSTTTYSLIRVEDSNSPNCSTNSGALLTGSAVVNVTALPAATLSATSGVVTTSSTICRGDSQELFFNMTGTGPFDIVYTDGTSVFPMLNNINSGHSVTIPSINSTKTYTISSVTDALGCTRNNVNSNVTVNVRNLPTIGISGTTSICVGSSTNLVFTVSGSSPMSFEYLEDAVLKTDTILSGNNSRVVSVSPSVTTTYTLVSVSDHFGCHSVSAIGSATITVIPSFASGAITNGNTSVCAGQSSVAYQIVPAQIQASSVNYQWSLNPATSGTIVSGQGSNQILIDWTNQANDVELSVVETRNFGGGLLCQGTPSTHNIIINQLPTGSISGSINVCKGESATLTFNFTGAGPFNIVYAAGSTNIPLNNILNGHQIDVTPTVPTNYTLKSIQDSNSPACQVNNINSSAFVNVRSLPTLAISGTRTICRGESTNLIFNLGGIGPWSFEYTDGVDTTEVSNVSSSSHPVSVSPLVTSTFNLVSVTDGNGCKTFKTATTLASSATITVNDLPSALISTVTDTICAGNVPTLKLEFFTGQAPYRVRYIDNNNLIYTLADVNPDASGIYTFTPQAIDETTTFTLFDLRDANNPNCFSNQNTGNLFGQADVTVNDLPVVALSTEPATIDNEATICFGDVQRLYFHIDGSGPFNVSYKEGNTIIHLTGISDGHFIEVSPADNIQYEIIAVSDNNNPVCSALSFGDQVTIFVNQLPEGTMTSAVSSICDGLDTKLIFQFQGANPWSFEFSDGSQTFSRSSNNVRFEEVVSPDVPTTYTLLSVTDANGCSITPNQALPVGINALPTAVLSGTDQHCQGTDIFIDIDLTGVGPWQVTYSNQSTNFNTTIAPAASYVPYVDTWSHQIQVFPALGDTEYSLVSVTDVGTGCISPLVAPGGATLTVFEIPVASITASNQVCVGSDATITFHITGGLAPYDIVIGRSDGLPNIVINNVNDDDTHDAIVNVGTTFTLLSVTDSRSAGSAQGCSASNLGQPAIVAANALPTAILSGDQILCYGDVAVLPVVLTGNGPFDLVYTDGTQMFTKNNVGATTDLEVTPLIDTEYTLFSVTDSNNPQCLGTVSGSAEISVYPELAPNFDTKDGAGNLTTTITLPSRRFFFTNTTPTPDAWDYVWDFGDGQVFTTPNPEEVNHEYATYGTYQVSLTASNVDCEETFTVDVTVAPIKPIAQFSFTPDQGCLPVEVQFTNESQFADPTRYRWEFGDGSISTAINPKHTYTIPGIYTVTLSATNPTEEVDREVKVQIIEVFAVPVAGFAVAPLEVFLPDQPIYTRNDSRDGTTFKWYFGDGDTATDYEPIHLYKEEGIYDITLIAYNDLGCTDTLTMTAAVNAREGGQIKVPNVFTPGAQSGSGGSGGLGFGDNKYFLPITDGVVAFELLIYNRWGELIFESTDRTKGWDGYYKGQLCPQDVYVFRLKATLESGEVLTKIGDVTLLR